MMFGLLLHGNSAGDSRLRFFDFLEMTVPFIVRPDCGSKTKGQNMMRFSSRITLLLVLTLSSLTVAVAQNSTAVEQLRSQLSDMQTKEAELQARLKQIDEDLRPENIEKFFALNGSTRPEELREQRRRQLESQKANVQSQLDQLAASRARLEAAIVTAEAATYRQSALTSTSNQPSEVGSNSSSPTVKPKQNSRRIHLRRARRARKRG
jgi:chromosome segregation ATPase